MATGAGWIDVYKRHVADWLVKRGYARWSGRTLYMTIPHFDAENNRMPGPMTGQEYYEGLCSNAAVTASASAWIAEARDGLAVGSGRLGTITTRSKIQRACIPKPAAPKPPRTPESIMDGMQRDLAAAIRWAEKLGCSPAELEELGRKGLLGVCYECGDVGVLDNYGKGRRKKCRKCLEGSRA